MPLTNDALDELAKLVAEEALNPPLRLQALDTLHAQSYRRLDRVLERALDSNSSPLRMRALELLRSDPARALAAAERFLNSSAELKERQQAITLLAKLNTDAADARLQAELERLLDGKGEPAFQLELLETVRARAKKNADLAQRLESYERQRTSAAASDALAAWSECLEGGDPQAGRKLFMTHLTAACVRCHRVGNTGSTVGPSLESIGKKRDRKHLLQSIIAPSAEIEPKYRSQTLVLLSGKIVQGLPLRRTEKLTILADAQGKEIKVKNDDIEESLQQQTSIMPEMGKALTRREIRDIVAWLATLRK